MILQTNPDGDQWWVLSDDEVRMGFLAQCVEGVASALGKDYRDVFKRLEAADMTENFIVKHYEVLHSQSMDNVVDDIVTALKNREEKFETYQVLNP